MLVVVAVVLLMLKSLIINKGKVKTKDLFSLIN